MKKIVMLFFVMLLAFACSNYKSDDTGATQTKEERSSMDYDASENHLYSIEDSEPISEAEEIRDKRSSGTASSPKIDYSRIISSSAATDNNISDDRKIIRRADVRFRANNVPEATYELERIVAAHGGWVSQTNLYTEQLSENRVKVSRDSTLVITRYVVRNSMTIRVPFASLDTVLHSFVPLIEHLDSRVITAEDVTFQILAEKLKQNRLAEYNRRMKRHTDSGASKLSDITEAEKQMLQQQERADAAFIEELKISDQIAYSTIYLDIYEKERFEKILVPDPEQIKQYKPGFGQRFFKALKNGWIIIQEIILGITHLWGILAVGIGLFFLIRYFIRLFSNTKKPKS